MTTSNKEKKRAPFVYRVTSIAGVKENESKTFAHVTAHTMKYHPFIVAGSTKQCEFGNRFRVLKSHIVLANIPWSDGKVGHPRNRELKRSRLPAYSEL
jgi:hypothetical protein